MPSLPHDVVNLEEYRRSGHKVVDWIADYRRDVADLPVMASVEPGSVYDALPAQAPEDPEAIDAILADVDALVVPALSHWQSPNWFAYFPSNAAEASLLGDMLSTGLGVQGMLWSTSPRLHRGGDAHARLDGPGPGPARCLSLRRGRSRWRSAPGHRVQCRARVHDRRAGAGHRWPHGNDRPRPVQFTARGLHLATSRTRVIEKSGQALRDRQRPPSTGRGRRRTSRCAPTTFASRLQSDLDASGDKPFFVNVTHWDHRLGRLRSPARDRFDRAQAWTVGAR